MSDELDATVSAVDPRRWAIQLCGVSLAVLILTGAIFHFTTRGLFERSEAPAPAAPVDPMRDVVSLDHGLAVYARQCAACHGLTGLGDGPAGATLNPKPRNFSTGWFKLGSTRSGMPTDGDLAATIRHGMLPAGMPPWPHLSDGEIKSVVMAVRHLAIEGRVAERLARTPAYPRDKAIHDVRAQLDPGPAIVLPPRPARIDLARGARFYAANCAACHDPDGRAKLRDDLVDNDDNPIAARDFTTGQFKGGNAVEDIALRVLRGIPGSPMPAAADVAADDLWSVAAYVRQFFDRPATPGDTASSAR